MNYELKYQVSKKPYLFDMSLDNKLYIYKNLKLVEDIQYDYEVSEDIFNDMIREYLKETK